jgi:cation/acetate symporter
VRIATSVSVMCVSLFYLLAQMAGAGGLVSLLLGVTGEAAQNIVIAVVGVVMIAYVLIGGMKGTTWVQIIKAVLLIAGAAVMTVWVAGEVRLLDLRTVPGPFDTTPSAVQDRRPAPTS